MRSIKDYYKQVDKVIKGHVDSVAALTAEKDAAYSELNSFNGVKRNNYTPDGLRQVQSEIRQRIREIDDKIKSIQATADRDVVRMYNEYMEELDKDELYDDDAVDTKFINVASAYKLTAADLNNKMQQYAAEGNHTMCKFVQEYAKNHKIELGVKYIGNDNERRIANDISFTVSKVMNNMDGSTSVYEKLMGANGLLAQAVNQ